MDNADLVKTFKDVIDYLSPLQTPTEQAIYNYLLRWSYFETGKNEIQIGDRTLAKNIGKSSRSDSKSKGMAPQAVGENIRNLVNKGHLEILKIHHLGKIYGVKLPSEIKESIELKKEKNTTPVILSEDYFNNPTNRKKIFERDNYKCYYCGQKLNENNSTLDHKIPLSKGGDNSKENLVACCLECNSIKGDKTLEEVATKLLERLKNRRA